MTPEQRSNIIERSDKMTLTANLPCGNWSQIRRLSLGGRAGFFVDQAETSVVHVMPEIISLPDYRKGFGHAEEIRI